MTSAHEVTAPVKEGEILAAKYRIENVIGVGGMGIVVSAMHLELDKRVALKFLLPQAAQNDELVGRFLREAKASVKLKGQHVAQVLDVGRMDDGRAYIVMEYLEGRDIGAELKASDEQFAIEDAVSWVLQACEGLAEAHALGIVHRDLKPGNLFLTRAADGRALVKVLDFGISKSINPNSSDMLSLTKTEMLLGSPLYMAPEQMRSSKHVDERSDIWALGAIAYELLCRRVPFEADTLLDLCFKVAQEGCVDVAEVRPEIPEELSQIVMRCLEKEPEARWNDIGELATALEPFAGAADRGSAARTVSILANGINIARSRKSDPLIRSASSSGDASDSKRISGSSKRQSSPDARRTTGGSKAVVVNDPVVSGTDATARVEASGSVSVSGSPSVSGAGSGSGPASAPGSASLETSGVSTSADDSVPDAVPASSAWGTTNARALGEKKRSNRVGLAAAGGVAVVLGIAFFVARGSGAPATTPTATTSPPVSAEIAPPEIKAAPTATLSATPAPSEAPAEPAATTVAEDPKPAPSTTTAPRATSTGAASTGRTAATGTAPRPKASVTASATATPPPVTSKPSSDFIRERE